MPDPLAIIDGRAQQLYKDFCAEQRRRRLSLAKPASWDDAPNWLREQWRERALLDIRSEESVLDQIKREDRERRSQSTGRPTSSEGNR